MNRTKGIGVAALRFSRRCRASIEVAPTLALLAPAGIYAALAYSMPTQYQFIVEDAAERVLPLLWAFLAMLFYFALALWALWTGGRFRPVLVGFAGMQLIAAFASYFVAAGVNSTILGLGAVGSVAIAAALWVSVKSAIGEPAAPRLSPWLPFLIALASYAGLGALTFFDAIMLPRTVGSLLILAVFAGALSVLLCVLTMRRRAAFVAIVFVIVALLFCEPNNHGITRVEARSPPLSMEQALNEWLTSRRDLNAYRSRGLPYPVIVVSSEGGGIYAAAHAYGTLSAIARNCPTFSQHVFATIGVSGGAVGNVLFASSIAPQQHDYTPCRPRAGAVNAAPILTDHMAPVLARFLLLEPIDRLLPGHWTERDRAQVLTDSVLSTAPDGNLAATPITDSFDPRSARPAVISVATDMATGRRLVMSPFTPDAVGQFGDWWPYGPEFTDLVNPIGPETKQIRLIDAAGLSARFPWITPTGRLRLHDRREESVLADGGYFDNSGGETVGDIYDQLRISEQQRAHYRVQAAEGNGRSSVEECATPAVRLVINFHEQQPWRDCEIPIFFIYFALASREPAPEDPADLELASPTQSFLSDPLSVLLATRSLRGEISLDRLDLLLCGVRRAEAECPWLPGSSLGMFRNEISPAAWRLPLGWFMSESHFRLILEETAPNRWFNYHASHSDYPEDTELMLWHLDPALYDQGANPSIYDLLPEP